MRELAEQVYPEVIRRVEALQQAFTKQWLTECKGQGLEIMDIRFGGLIQRLKTCAQRLLTHLDAGVRIEELEDEILPFKWKNPDDEHLAFYNWHYYVTVNTMVHIL